MRSVVLSRTVIALIVGILVILGTIWWLRPNVEGGADSKFMHCNVCKQEMIYQPKLAGSRCPRCKPPNIGTLVATRESIGAGGGNPWRTLNIAVSIEAIVLLGVVVLILSYPPRAAKLDYGYTQCNNCGRRLRFPAHRAGNGAGWCPLCKAMFAYPAEIGEPFHDE